MHRDWLAPAEDRTFSLAVSFYGSDPVPWRDGADLFVEARGAKWPPLADLVDQHWEWVSSFDYVAFPDDDLGASATDWRRLFEVMAELDLDLGQPALADRCFWTHGITVQRPGLRARFTNFVEVMTPVFSRWAIERCLPTFRMSPSGFGLDFVWPKVVENGGRRSGIVDEVAFFHTRPFRGSVPLDPSARGSEGVYGQLAYPPAVDEFVMSQVFGIHTPFDPVTVAALPRVGPPAPPAVPTAGAKAAIAESNEKLFAFRSAQGSAITDPPLTSARPAS